MVGWMLWKVCEALSMSEANFPFSESQSPPLALCTAHPNICQQLLKIATKSLLLLPTREIIHSRANFFILSLCPRETTDDTRAIKVENFKRRTHQLHRVLAVCQTIFSRDTLSRGTIFLYFCFYPPNIHYKAYLYYSVPMILFAATIYVKDISISRNLSIKLCSQLVLIVLIFCTLLGHQKHLTLFFHLCAKQLLLLLYSVPLVSHQKNRCSSSPPCLFKSSTPCTRATGFPLCVPVEHGAVLISEQLISIQWLLGYTESQPAIERGRESKRTE